MALAVSSLPSAATKGEAARVRGPTLTERRAAEEAVAMQMEKDKAAARAAHKKNNKISTFSTGEKGKGRGKREEGKTKIKNEKVANVGAVAGFQNQKPQTQKQKIAT